MCGEPERDGDSLLAAAIMPASILAGRALSEDTLTSLRCACDGVTGLSGEPLSATAFLASMSDTHSRIVFSGISRVSTAVFSMNPRALGMVLVIAHDAVKLFL